MQFDRSDENVSNRVFKGAMFLTGARFVLRLSSLANLVVLGRLLSPQDYGVAALAIVVIGFIQVFSDVRVNSALIAMKTIDKPLLDTAFTMNLARGMIIAAILLLFAGPIAAFMDEPRLEPVLRVICVVLIFDGLRNPAFLMYQRNIDFSREFRRNASATVIGMLAAIAVAVLTRSYWAIVAGTLAGRFTEMAFSYYRVPYRPKFGLEHWRDFLGFGGWLTAAGMVGYLQQMASQVLIGKFLGAGPLGFYSVGKDISNTATRELAYPLQQALTPGLAAVASDPDRLRRAFRKAQSTILGVAMPIGIGTALMAKELLAILVGTKWLASADVIVLLAPAIAFAMISAATSSLALAQLATRAMFMRSAFVASVGLPIIGIALWKFGFTGVVVATMFRLLFETLVNMVFASTLLNDGVFAPLLSGWRTIVSAAIMTGVVLAIPAPFVPGQSELVVLVEMLPRVLAGVAAYSLMHLLLWRVAGCPDGFETKMLEFLGIVGKNVRFLLKRA